MPEFTGTDHCKSPRCRGSIIWCYTERGKRMPVDYLPHVEGNIAVEFDEARGVDTCRVLTGFDIIQAEPGTLHRSHFATCVDPDIYRRSRAGSR